MKPSTLSFYFFIFSLITLLISIYFYISSPVLLSPEKSVNQQKIIRIKINEDGTSEEHIIWRVNMESKLLKFAPSEWGLYIPKESTNIKVIENSNKLNFKTESAKNPKYNVLLFKNPSSILSGKNHQFDISYKVNKNPIVFEPSYYYKRTFTRFKTDDVYTIEISLPQNSKISTISPLPKNKYNKNNRKILEFALNRGQTKEILLNFQLNTNSNIKLISSEKFEAKVPERYANTLTTLLKKADKLEKDLEKKQKMTLQDKWKISFINLADPDFEPDKEAFYLGDKKIKIKTTILQKSETKFLITLIHEVVHGFNSEIFKDNVPDFWWNEGTAQYLSLNILKNEGYDVSKEINKKEKLLNSCKNIDKTFISTWSPSTSDKENILCGDINTNKLELGYALSYGIVKTLGEVNPEIFSEIKEKSEKQNIKFSSDHNILNNQLNYILSDIQKEETTNLLNSLNIKVDSLSKEEKYTRTILTGLNIAEENNKTNLIIPAIIILLTIILLILILKNNPKQ